MEIQGPDGLRLRLIATGPELLEMEAIYRETAGVPPRHAPPDGGRRPSRVRWQVRPALGTAEFFERLYGDGADSARAAPSIAEFLAGFRRRDPADVWPLIRIWGA